MGGVQTGGQKSQPQTVLLPASEMIGSKSQSVQDPTSAAMATDLQLRYLWVKDRESTRTTRKWTGTLVIISVVFTGLIEQF